MPPHACAETLDPLFSFPPLAQAVTAGWAVAALALAAVALLA